MNLPKKINNNLFVILLTGILAVSVRVVMFISVINSPFKMFHKVPGLDMQTLLHFAQWGDENPVVPIFFTLHRLMVSIIWNINGKIHSVETIFIIQQILGVILSILVAWSVLHLFRNRIYALLSGISSALYAPALMYECTTLQESLVTFAFFSSFAALIWAKKHHFKAIYSIILGLSLALSSVGRPTTVIWVIVAMLWITLKAKPRKRTFFVAGTIGIIYLFCAIFNFHFNSWASPFFQSNYVLSLGGKDAKEAYTKQQNAPSANAPTGELTDSINRLTRVGIKGLGRIHKVFDTYEIPNNINYYFIREKLPILKYLFGPSLIISLALSSTIVIIYSGAFRKREGLLLLALVSTLLPICAIMPLARYKLLLYGIFCILAFYPLYSCHKLKDYLIFLGIFVAIFTINTLNMPEKRLRSSDFVSWGTAINFLGNKTTEAEDNFLEAYIYSNGNQSAAVNLLVSYIPSKKYKEAELLLNDALTRPHINRSLMLYYYGLLRISQNRYKEAEKYFKDLEVKEIGILSGKYHFFLAESLRMQKDILGANTHYQEALKGVLPQGMQNFAKKMLKNSKNNLLK